MIAYQSLAVECPKEEDCCSIFRIMKTELVYNFIMSLVIYIYILMLNFITLKIFFQYEFYDSSTQFLVIFDIIDLS